MPPSKDKEVLYDIRPVNSAGQVDIEKINRVKPELDLRNKSEVHQDQKSLREEISKAFNEETANDDDLAVLKDVGATLLQSGPVKNPLRRNLISRPALPSEEPELKRPDPALLPPPLKLPEFHPTPTSPRPKPVRTALQRITVVRTSAPAELPSPVSREIDHFLTPAALTEEPGVSSAKTNRTNTISSLGYYLFWAGVGVAIIFLTIKIIDRGQHIKESFIKKSTEGSDNLKNAKADIVNFDFSSAANNFTLAYDNFSKASSRLDGLGSAFTSFLGEVPGFKKMKAAKNIVKAGENISKAGETLALSIDNLYGTNFVSYLGFDFLGGKDGPVSASYFINLFKDAALFAQKRLETSTELLAAVDEAALPNDKREEFIDLRAQVPVLAQYMGRAVDYSSFLLEALGKSGPKKYLILFQNNTELRPAGGFPGSYALIGFNHGFLREFKVDDIYNIDSRARKNIIPPKELQHITPTWGMRDANWFLNFPDSAKKVMQMYTENDGGPEVDGVITITPAVIVKILEILGPIELPEYNLTLDQNNFLAEIQEEVEYGENRVQPKQVLVDFTPKFIDKLSQQDKEQWFKIVKILLEGTEHKQVLAYFRDPDLQKVAEDNDFAGIVKNTNQDYLLVTHTNVKGAKTDAVIDNSYDLKSSVDQDGFIEHTLTITRKHNGGKTDYGFYNRQSYDYLRVLVPKGSTLVSIQGQSKANFTPLIRNYSDDYTEDADLKKYETEDVSTPVSGVKQFVEADKTGFGFWLFLAPGGTKAVTIKYKTPVQLEDNEYLLMVQKQPGTPDDNFDFSFDLPSGKNIIFQHPDLQLAGSQATYRTTLVKDLIFGIKLQ